MGDKYVILPRDIEITHPEIDDASVVRIRKIRQEARKHVGQLAILYRFNDRSAKPRAVTIDSIHNSFIRVHYPCYSADGTFSQNLYDTVSYIDLYCRTSSLEYLDSDDI